MIKVYFNRPGTPFPRHRLLNDLAQASERIAIASAWFTDTDIADAWIASPAAAEKIAILSRADLHRDGSQKVLTRLKAYAATTRITTHICILGSNDFRQGVMHHKFALINRHVIWVGSYNFTFQAKKNYETILRIEDPVLAMYFWEEVRAIVGDEEGWDSGVPPGSFYCEWCQTVKANQYISERLGTGGDICTWCLDKVSEQHNQWMGESIP